MLTTLPHVLSHFDLFVDGRGYGGVCSSIKLPVLQMKVEEFRAGGLDGPIPIDLGTEKMECEITLAEYDPVMLAQWGFTMGGAVALTARGVMKGAPLASSPTIPIPVTAQMRGRITKYDMGTWKSGEMVEINVTVFCTYYSISIGGVQVIEIDVENMIRKVGGQDQLELIRAAIGRV